MRVLNELIHVPGGKVKAEVVMAASMLMLDKPGLSLEDALFEANRNPALVEDVRADWQNPPMPVSVEDETDEHSPATGFFISCEVDGELIAGEFSTDESGTVTDAAHGLEFMIGEFYESGLDMIKAFGRIEHLNPA